MDDPRRYAVDTSDPAIVQALNICLKHSLADFDKDLYGESKTRLAWRSLGGSMRDAANRAVRTVLVTMGERRRKDFGETFPNADGVVLDLLVETTVHDMGRWIHDYIGETHEKLAHRISRLTIKVHIAALDDLSFRLVLQYLTERSTFLCQVALKVCSASDSLDVTIKSPGVSYNSGLLFRKSVKEAFRSPIHRSLTWLNGPCVVSFKHLNLKGAELRLRVLTAQDREATTAALLHTRLLQALVQSNSLEELVFSRPLTIEQGDLASLSRFKELTALTRFEAPEAAALSDHTGRLVAHMTFWLQLVHLPRLKHIAVLNTGANCAFDHIQDLRWSTALTSLELGKSWGAAPASTSLLQLGKGQLCALPALKKLQSLVVRATTECFEKVPEPGSTVLTQLVLSTGMSSKMHTPAWLPNVASSLTTLTIGPVELDIDFFKSLANASKLENLQLAVTSINSSLYSGMAKSLDAASKLPAMRSLVVTFTQAGGKLIKPYDMAPLLLLLKAPHLKEARFSTYPVSPAFGLPGELFLPLRELLTSGSVLWKAAAMLFSSCVVVVEDGSLDLTDEALARAKELLPKYTGGLALWLGPKVTPVALSRLMRIWPSQEVVMRGQPLPLYMKKYLRYQTPLALTVGHIQAMQGPAALQIAAEGSRGGSVRGSGSSSGGSSSIGGSSGGSLDVADELKQFKNLDLHSCQLLQDDALVAAAGICQQGGSLQFRGCVRATDALFRKLAAAKVTLGSVQFWGASSAKLTVAGCRSLLAAGAAERVFLQCQGSNSGQWI